jgi:periplasmic divalent cation tolerance protein
MAIVVLVTIPKKNAVSFSKILLRKRVCACVNIIDQITSLYWWEGKLEKGKESLLIIKTKNSKFKKLEETVKKNHPYSVPEIISLKVNKINKEYLAWIEKEVNA